MQPAAAGKDRLAASQAALLCIREHFASKMSAVLPVRASITLCFERGTVSTQRLNDSL